MRLMVVGGQSHPTCRTARGELARRARALGAAARAPEYRAGRASRQTAMRGSVTRSPPSRWAQQLRFDMMNELQADIAFTPKVLRLTHVRQRVEPPSLRAIFNPSQPMEHVIENPIGLSISGDNSVTQIDRDIMKRLIITSKSPTGDQPPHPANRFRVVTPIRVSLGGTLECWIDAYRGKLMCLRWGGHVPITIWRVSPMAQIIFRHQSDWRHTLLPLFVTLR